MKRIPLADEELLRFCRRHGIRRLSLFGRALEGTARPDNDLDLLVECEADARPAKGEEP